MKQWIAMTALAVTIVGCGSDSDNDGQTGTRPSAACVEWRQALCDFAERCGAPAATVSECRQDVTAIHCVSDERAKTCSSKLKTGACSATTADDCDLSDLADRAAAKTACTKFANAACDGYARCGESSKEDCLKQPDLVNLCEQAIGYKPALDQCINELGTLACSAESSPDACNGAIVVKE
jgi:hypothetical protein